MLEVKAVAVRADRSEGPAEGEQQPSIEQPAPGALRRTLRTASLASTALLATAATLYFARPVLFPVLLAILLSLLLSPVVRALSRIHVPEFVGAAIVMLMLGMSLGSLGLHLYEPAREWLDNGGIDMRKIEKKVRILKGPFAVVKDASDRVTEIAAGGAPPPKQVVIERPYLWGMVGGTQGFFVGTLVTVVLLFFLLASGDLFLRKLIRVVPGLRHKIRAVEITRTIEREIGRYYGTVLAINIGLGVATTLALSLLDVPTPALWGTTVAVLNFVPYVGPLISFAIITLVSILSFDQLGAILAPPAAFAVITLIEGHVIQPLTFGRRLALNPVVIFLAVVAWGGLWGVAGILVAVPVLVAVKICADHIPGWEPLAEFIGPD